MNIFHYHHWTNLLEETENFYVQHGFDVRGRYAKGKKGIENYHPLLKWEDFRDESPLFRIIEVRKGKVNVTFGFGEKPIFDHIGFLVTIGNIFWVVVFVIKAAIIWIREVDGAGVIQTYEFRNLYFGDMA